MKKCILLSIMLLMFITGCGTSELTITNVHEENTEDEQVIASATKDSDEISDSFESDESQKTDNSEEEEQTIIVYVCGAVVNEGVYELPAGSRKSDALKEAGGYDDNALHGYVNLAEKVEDEERVYFPDYDELEELGILSSDTSTVTEASADTFININTADAETLKTLPGIGETKAADIVAYRESNGSFSSIEDIMNVSGIGESTFNRIKSRISVN